MRLHSDNDSDYVLILPNRIDKYLSLLCGISIAIIYHTGNQQLFFIVVNAAIDFFISVVWIAFNMLYLSGAVIAFLLFALAIILFIHPKWKITSLPSFGKLNPFVDALWAFIINQISAIGENAIIGFEVLTVGLPAFFIYLLLDVRNAEAFGHYVFSKLGIEQNLVAASMDLGIPFLITAELFFIIFTFFQIKPKRQSASSLSPGRHSPWL